MLFEFQLIADIYHDKKSHSSTKVSSISGKYQLLNQIIIEPTILGIWHPSNASYKRTTIDIKKIVAWLQANETALKREIFPQEKLCAKI